jgi:predicted N-acetyltransferase YhbS
MGRTFVAVEETPQVLGYHTIASGSITPESIPRSAPQHPIPVILLARLAVDSNLQKAGLGKELLLDALKRASQIAEILGVHAVSLDCLNEGVKPFYLKYGFEELNDSPLHLYMPIKRIRQLNL